MTRKLVLALLLLCALPLFGAGDVLTVGSLSGRRGDTVAVPVYVRDVGGSLLGILGALLAIPVAATVQIVVKEWWAFRRERLLPTPPPVDAPAEA